jgi:hypothetical protein
MVVINGRISRAPHQLILATDQKPNMITEAESFAWYDLGRHDRQSHPVARPVYGVRAT